jgi:hypothetical protein
MALYDMDRSLKEFTLKAAEKSDQLQIGISRIHSSSMAKMIRTVDIALENLKPSLSNNLTWTMTAALLGYNVDNSKSSDHVWEKAFEAFRHHVKSSNIFVGCLVRWRITVLANQTNDQWFTTQSETDGIDIDTGKSITRATYWINNDFIMPKITVVLGKKKTEINDFGKLAAKFNRR